MTKSVVRIVTMAGLAACLLAAPAMAQVNDRLQATIPFAFQVGGKMLPAGDYDILLNASPGVVVLRNSENYQAAGVLTHRTERKPSAQPSLVFERHGESHFLSTVWPSSGTGYQVPRRSIEGQIAKLNRQPAGNTEMKAVALKTNR
ncbi:MAG: hypothetical protein HY235_18690 [Acidobacteria bacterium]|nr:hypothetical protein [Acidobacteriota bacterium]